MRRDFTLENGIICIGEYNNFKLYYNNIALTSKCHAIAYVPKTLIAVKCNKTVYVYKPNISLDEGVPTLIKLASFEVFNAFAYMKIKINGNVYIIDSNVQISLCECPKMY